MKRRRRLVTGGAGPASVPTGRADRPRQAAASDSSHSRNPSGDRERGSRSCVGMLRDHPVRIGSTPRAWSFHSTSVPGREALPRGLPGHPEREANRLPCSTAAPGREDGLLELHLEPLLAIGETDNDRKDVDFIGEVAEVHGKFQL